MKNHDVNIYWGKATIEITIQEWEYKGSYKIEMSGNIKAGAFIESGLETETLENSDIIWNNCNLKIEENIEGERIYKAELKDKKGNELVVDGYVEELKDYIVEIKMVDYVEEE